MQTIWKLGSFKYASENVLQKHLQSLQDSDIDTRQYWLFRHKLNSLHLHGKTLQQTDVPQHVLYSEAFHAASYPTTATSNSVDRSFGVHSPEYQDIL